MKRSLADPLLFLNTGFSLLFCLWFLAIFHDLYKTVEEMR